MNISLSPFASENLVSPDRFGRPVPSRPVPSRPVPSRPAPARSFSTLRVNMYAVYSRDSSLFPRRRPFIIRLDRQPPSSQSRVYEVTQLRTDGVHCRESASAGPIVLKVVRVTGAAFSGIAMDQLMCASLFPHPLLYCYVLIADMMTCYCVISTESIGGEIIISRVSFRPVTAARGVWE